MSTSPTTPTRTRSTNFATPAPATPSRLNASQSQASPHYTTTRRHSLYGVEDRVVIDPGSCVWKVGFSGEGRPRSVFYGGFERGLSLWGLNRSSNLTERAEEERILAIRLEKAFRHVFHECLLTDPKTRRVILIEHPLLPIYIKETMTRILFDNLQVHSVSFASSHLLSLFAVGRITGLVLDCGTLESTVLPIFAARPLYPQLKTTPLAGARLTAHLRALLLLFGTYLPPSSSLSSAINVPAANRATRVPQEILTDAFIDELKTRCLFVGKFIGSSPDTREDTPAPDDPMSEYDIPPSSDATPSESEFSHPGVSTSEMESVVSSQHPSSEFSIISTPRQVPGDTRRSENHLQALASMYSRNSTATELHVKVEAPGSQGTGQGTLIIPGWIRERGAEVLFDGGDVDESSIAETVLDALLRIPVDLRKTMACSILVTGGTSMMPGFIPRLQAEIIRALNSFPTGERQFDRYGVLRPITPYIAILNNPSPTQAQTGRAQANAGRAPAFVPATMSWVGGSLAGSMKVGGVEVSREKWDAAEHREDPDMSMDVSLTTEDLLPTQLLLPDWTRSPLSSGAPNAAAGATSVSVPPTPSIGVGA